MFTAFKPLCFILGIASPTHSATGTITRNHMSEPAPSLRITCPSLVSVSAAIMCIGTQPTQQSLGFYLVILPTSSRSNAHLVLWVTRDIKGTLQF